jgi:fatty acid synthase
MYCIAGPSYAVDTAGSSSGYAFEQAYGAIQDGHCDSAFVGASQLSLCPCVSVQLSELGVLNPQDFCGILDRDGE